MFQNMEKQAPTQDMQKQNVQTKGLSTASKVGIGLGVATLIGGGYLYMKHKK